MLHDLMRVVGCQFFLCGKDFDPDICVRGFGEEVFVGIYGKRKVIFIKHMKFCEIRKKLCFCFANDGI